jgi:hypothetical protein
MARAVTTALVVSACLVAAPRAVVAGGKTTKVTFETDPPGAKVYFNLKEDGEVCTTPCTVDAPIGETTVIIEAENRRSLFENLVVPRRTARPIRVQYKLEPAIGALIVEGNQGATIKIDDEPRGKAPARIDGVIAGPHRVVLERNGKPVYDEFLEIEAGREATVAAVAIAAARPAPQARAEIAATVHAQAPEPARRTAFAVTGVVDIGFRRFRYDDNRTPATQRDDHESGQILAGPIIEVWPTTLLGLHVLPGLALYARLELGINSQAVTLGDAATTRTSLTTAWRSIEVSVHQRWTIPKAGTIEVGAGYAEDSYQFDGDPAEIAIVPDARYSAVRIGGRASLLFGSLEPYVTTENRIVLSGGAMEQRYRLGTSVNGVHGALGAVLHLGSLEARVEGGLTLYSWTFKPAADGMAQAKGGSDFIRNVTLALGYVY